MLVPKKNRLAVYSYLFREGVIVAKKDYTMNKHAQIEVPNVQVCRLMQSLKSRGFVKEQFNWQWLYFYLTNEGIDYLREYLHVSEETLPNTLKKQQKAQPPASFRQYDDRDRGDRRRGDRDNYRGQRKEGDFNPRFEGRGRGRGGFGRGGRGGFERTAGADGQ